LFSLARGFKCFLIQSLMLSLTRLWTLDIVCDHWKNHSTKKKTNQQIWARWNRWDELLSATNKQARKWNMKRIRMEHKCKSNLWNDAVDLVIRPKERGATFALRAQTLHCEFCVHTSNTSQMCANNFRIAKLKIQSDTIRLVAKIKRTHDVNVKFAM
jgi:hypothetical protein